MELTQNILPLGKQINSYRHKHYSIIKITLTTCKKMTAQNKTKMYAWKAYMCV